MSTPLQTPTSGRGGSKSSKSSKNIEKKEIQYSPETQARRQEWKSIYDKDIADDGPLELVLESNGITKEKFLDGVAERTTELELFLLCIPSGVPCLQLFSKNLLTLRLMNIGLKQVNYLDSLTQLQVLWLNENELSGNLEISSSQGISGSVFSKLENLRELYLHFNNIESLGNSLKNLTNLEVLWLNENKLSGPLEGIENCTNLKVLNLGNNKISALEFSNTNSNNNNNTALKTFSTSSKNSNSINSEKVMISTSSSLPSSIEELNVAGNQFQRFSNLQPILELPKLSKLTLNDSTYGTNPVCRLSNLHTFLIFHARSLQVLDGIEIQPQQRVVAKSTYLQKYAFYGMRARTLRNHMRLLETEISRLIQTRTTQLLSGLLSLQRQLYFLREVDSLAIGSSPIYSSSGTPQSSTTTNSSVVTTTGKNDSTTTTSAFSSASATTASGYSSFDRNNATPLIPPQSHSPLFAPPIEQLASKIKDSLQILKKLEVLGAEAGDEMQNVVDEVVSRYLSELHTGGNVRYEDQMSVPSSENVLMAMPSLSLNSSNNSQNNNLAAEDAAAAAVWYRSCVDLFRSRMFLPDFATSKGISDLTVTRVTKIHNKSLRSRFDHCLEELVDVSDPSFKRGIEYLFLVLPPTDNYNDDNEEDGNKNLLASSSLTGLDSDVGPRMKMKSRNSSSSSSSSNLTKHELEALFIEEGHRTTILNSSFRNASPTTTSSSASASYTSSSPRNPSTTNSARGSSSSTNNTNSNINNISSDPVVLTNSIFLHESHRLSKCKSFASSNTSSQLKNGSRVVLCKVFLGRSFPESPELSVNLNNCELSSSLPNIDGRKVLPPDTHAVMRTKKLPLSSILSSDNAASATTTTTGTQNTSSASASTSSSTNNSNAPRQRVWFVYRPELVLPEYVIHFDYKSSAGTSSSSPPGDVSAFPWLTQHGTNEKIKDEFLACVRSQGLASDPTRRGDLDAMLTRANAAAFSLSISSSTTSSTSHHHHQQNNQLVANNNSNNNNDLLLLMPQLLKFATKSHDLVTNALRVCSDVNNTISEKIEQFKRSQPTLFERVHNHSNNHSNNENNKNKNQDNDDDDDAYALIKERSNSSAFIHSFSNKSNIISSSSVSGNKKHHQQHENTSNNSTTTTREQIMRAIIELSQQPSSASPSCSWTQNLQTLILPFANLGPKLPLELSKHVFPSLLELDLSHNNLSSYCIVSSSSGSENNNNSNSNNVVGHIINAPSLLRLNLSCNELSSSQDLETIKILYCSKKLQHLQLFGNKFSSASSNNSKKLEEFIISTEFKLETMDGFLVHEKLTELRSLPTSVKECTTMFSEYPNWFELCYDSKNPSSSVVSSPITTATAATSETQNSNNNNNNNMSFSSDVIFTQELLPQGRITKRLRCLNFLNYKLQSSLKLVENNNTNNSSTSENSSLSLDQIAGIDCISTFNASFLRINTLQYLESFCRLQRLDLSGNSLDGSNLFLINSSSSSKNNSPMKNQQQNEDTNNISNSNSSYQPISLPLLQFLSLAKNNLTSLKGLDTFAPTLRALDVQGNELTSLLGAPTSLRILFAENNRLTTLNDLPKTLAHRLVELYLADNCFFVCRDAILPLRENSDLFILDLARNPFRDGELDTMYFALCHLPKIKVYNSIPVDNNHLAKAKEVYAGKLSEELVASKAGPPSQWQTVKELNFSNLSLKEIDLIKSFTRVQHVSLEGNLISNISPLSKCLSLSSLDLSFNRTISGHSGQTGHAMNFGISLSNMNMNNNNFNSSSNGSVSQNLTSLALEGCGITCVAALNLNLPNLRFLNLKGNEITDMIATSPYSTTSMSNANNNNNSQNNQNSNNAENTGFDKLIRLKELILDQNKIKIIDGLGRCQQLEKLSMDENLVKNLEGVKYLPNLSSLSVALNRITDLNEFESVALCGTFVGRASTNNQNANLAIQRPSSAGGGDTINSRPTSARSSSKMQQQQQQQPQNLCRVETLNVASNPCIRKLGNPAYRILCCRMIPTLRTIDNNFVSQEEYDRAYPPEGVAPCLGTNIISGPAQQAMLMMNQQVQQQQQQQQQQLQQQNIAAAPTSSQQYQQQQVFAAGTNVPTTSNQQQQQQVASLSNPSLNIQPLRTFQMMEPAPVLATGYRATTGGFVRDNSSTNTGNVSMTNQQQAQSLQPPSHHHHHPHHQQQQQQGRGGTRSASSGSTGMMYTSTLVGGPNVNGNVVGNTTTNTSSNSGRASMLQPTTKTATSVSSTSRLVSKRR